MTNPSESPAISVSSLSKSYGQRVAVEGVTFDVPRGVVAGFIGPNGAGKTTTMAMLLGLIAPSSGSGSVLGVPLRSPERYLPQVGALIESPALYPGLTGAENLRLLATLSGRDASRIPELLDLVGLAERGDDRFKQYSLGMKQRLGIAAALLGDPALLVLDEPTNGLDPIGMREIRDVIARVAAQDRTVLVSSHLLGEMEQVCDWLVVIERGAIGYAGPAAQFVGGRATLELAPENRHDLQRLGALLAADGYELDRGDGELVVFLDADDVHTVAGRVNRLAFEHDMVLARLAPRRRNLEERYLALIEGEER